MAVLIEYEYRQGLSTSTKNQADVLVIVSNLLALSENCPKMTVFHLGVPSENP